MKLEIKNLGDKHDEINFSEVQLLYGIDSKAIILCTGKHSELFFEGINLNNSIYGKYDKSKHRLFKGEVILKN